MDKKVDKISAGGTRALRRLIWRLALDPVIAMNARRANRLQARSCEAEESIFNMLGGENPSADVAWST
jgi:hypothetical protein